MSLENDINSLALSVGLELYDTNIVSEFDETIYRVSVVSSVIKDTKRQRVDMDKCVEFTHLISPLLDIESPISGQYRLEVGSPGIERSLSNIGHYKKSIGEKVSILLDKKVKAKGLLVKVDNSKIFIKNNEEICEYLFKDIIKAKIYFEWK